MDRHATISGTEQGGDVVLRLDRLLCFSPWVAERYERERGKERVKALRHLIYVGLPLYNAYTFTAFFLTPDIIWLAIWLRVFLVTPGSWLHAWLLGKVTPFVREWLVAFAMIFAFGAPAFLFWFTTAPLGNYVFAEVAFLLVYTNMLMLRFKQAIAFTLCAAIICIVVALTKAGIPRELSAAFLIQGLTACVLTLYANYRSEIVRCSGYLEELRAVLKSEAAEAESHRFLDLSLTDALTTLPNRRSLDETATRWSTEGAALAVMMIDVDHFKLFNDTLGHPAGDECLRAIGTALSRVTAGTGHFVARFGGEEFTVVARDLDPLGTARLAKGLVEAIEALGIVHPGRSDGCGIVTISAGIALKQADTDLEAVFKLADTALYEAKRRGRNRYVLAESAIGLSHRLNSA